MNLEQLAKYFATVAHQGQKRKYTLEPYINHPEAVVELVRGVPHSSYMLAAAWLHDVVEDCGVKIEEIQATFGNLVALMVFDLTDVSKPGDGNRKVRKEKDRLHLAGALPDSKTIKLADLIDNTRTIVQYDPDFAKVYLREKRELLKVLKEGDPALYAQAEKQIGGI